jgi:hypothetical protein
VAKKRQSSDHRTFPNPDSVLARKVREEARTVSIDEIRKAPPSTTRREWKGAARAWGRSVTFRNEFDALHDKVTPILESNPGRRVRTAAPSKTPAERSQEITLALLATSRLHEWHRRSNTFAGDIPLGPPFRVGGKVKQPMLVGGLSGLVKNVNTARAELRRAQKRWDRLPQDPSFKAMAPVHGACFIARQHLATAKEELIAFRSGGLVPRELKTPGAPMKHRLPPRFAAAYGILHELHDIHGISDVGISQLLEAADLPALSPRNIKRIRQDFRRT